MTQQEFDKVMLTAFPALPWLEPVAVSLFGGERHYGCRLCLARNGLHGKRVHALPTDIEVVRKHIAESHVIQKQEERAGPGRV
jgi:hypothetical protein